MERHKELLELTNGHRSLIGISTWLNLSVLIIFQVLFLIYDAELHAIDPHEPRSLEYWYNLRKISLSMSGAQLLGGIFWKSVYVRAPT